MATIISVPSGTNTYVPSHEASGALVVGYSRDPKKFPLARYVQYYPTKNNVGLFLRWTSQEGARVLTDTDDEHNWADGTAAPIGDDQLESMDWESFLTLRKCYPYMMGGMAVEQASWPVWAAQGRVAAQKAMTARTAWTHYLLKNAAWGANTAAVDGAFGPTPILPSGQNWTNGGVGYGSTVNYVGASGPNIKQSIQYGCIQIHLNTMGVVRPDDLTLVINPNTANAMARSTEIQDYIKQSPDALAQLMGNKPNQNGQWGLPETLYGVRVTVEDCVRIKTNVNISATATSSYAMADGDAYLLAREGELQGLEGSRSFSTVQIFFHNDEMTVETKYDPDNRRYMGRVISDYVPVVASVQSGFYFQHVLGT